ncbi:MAG: hypothetical protein CMB11_07945 [Euryarchaeota archaeon]|nr:hypothetical protein [Euryarchaeota archaeon]
MTKSQSMPEFDPSLEEGEQSPPTIVERDVWVCQGAGDGKVHRLQPNSDGGLSCVCGIVARGVDMISLARFKNCSESMDPTKINDGPPRAAASQQAPWANGPERKEDRERRESAQLGGTHVSNACARKNDMQQALREVDRQARRDAARRDAAATFHPNAPDQGRGRKLSQGLECAIAKLPLLRTLKNPIAEHVRIEAVRIYQLSVRHEQKCGCKGCIYALSTRNMVVLTLGLIELVLSQLAGIEEGDGRRAEDISQGAYTKQDMQRTLAQLYQVQEEFKVNQLQRLELLSAVHRISKWTKQGQELFACASDDVHSRSSLFLPAARTAVGVGEFGKDVAPDPGDNTGKLRLSLEAALKGTPMDAESREMITYQLRVPEVMDYMAQEGLPRDVLAIAVVAATARKLEKDDPTDGLRSTLINPLNIASSTVDDFIERLALRIQRPPVAEEEGEPLGAQRETHETRDKIFDA